jgi:hypothetical protein
MSDKTVSKKENLFGLYFWLHLPLVLIANLSFLIADYRLIAFGVFLLLLQFFVLKGCILTIKQFGTYKDMTFYTIYLEKMGFKFNRRKFMLYMKYVHPFVILLIAIILQAGFGYIPPLHF